jgi:hypothetical protein
MLVAIPNATSRRRRRPLLLVFLRGDDADADDDDDDDDGTRSLTLTIINRSFVQPFSPFLSWFTTRKLPVFTFADNQLPSL